MRSAIISVALIVMAGCISAGNIEESQEMKTLKMDVKLFNRICEYQPPNLHSARQTIRLVETESISKGMQLIKLCNCFAALDSAVAIFDVANKGIKAYLLSVLLILFFLTSFASGNTKFISQNGYDNCIELSNGYTRVVLEPNCGGRVLIYEFNKTNVMYIDPQQDGWLYDPEFSKRIEPCAGRCDVGHNLPFHPILWYGKYKAEITGPFSARMTSQEDSAVGIQINREFKLDEKTSHLIFTQTIKNISDTPQRLGHWSRTFAVGNGIALVPLHLKSRFPSRYITNGPNRELLYLHEEPPENCRIRDDIFEIYGVPPNPKFYFDSQIGWLAYVTRSNRLFIKKFTVYPDLLYGDEVGSTASIWYFKDEICEIEPMGPYVLIPPGESHSFTEHWYLLEHQYPKNNKIDLILLKDIIKHCR